MRGLMWTTFRRLALPVASLSSISFCGALAGALIAIAIYSQLVASFGLTFGIRVGLTVACILGIGWGRSLVRQETQISATRLWFHLAALLLLWPTWMAGQLEAVALLPLDVWENGSLADVFGFVFAILSGTIPVALLTQWLLVCGSLRWAIPGCVPDGKTDEKHPWSWSSVLRSLQQLAERDLQHSHWRSVGGRQPAAVVFGVACGLVLSASVLGPWVGIGWPAWIVAAFIALVIGLSPSAYCPLRAEVNYSGLTERPVGSPSASVIFPMLLVAAGWQWQALGHLLKQVSPATMTSQSLGVAAFLVSAGLGLSWHQFRAARTHSTHSISSGQAAGSLLVASLLQVCLSSQLVDLSFWIASHVLHPVLLEACRGLIVLCLTLPLGIWVGRLLASHSHWFSGVLALPAGYLLGQLAAPAIGDPLLRMWATCLCVCLSGVAIIVKARLPRTGREPSSIRWWRPVGIAVLLLSAGLLSPLTWPTERAVKLLYSTPALLGARSGWPTDLLTEMDDTHLVEQVAGREGTWTLWRQRGADLILRRDGIPRGSLTSRAEWSPQYAPEVACAAWPLVLVDQPARVLVLGAGSSVPLQTALAFPISEVVCSESDLALLDVLNHAALTDQSFNPFRDHRCRTIHLPTAWLSLPASEQFDVIVSSPIVPALPAAASEMTTSFYLRSARHLSEQGVFCQRVSAVDFGPQPLMCAALSMQEAFAATACLEVGPGEYLLLGAHRADALVRPDLAARLEMPHVSDVLAHCNWDWSLPLNLPAYDGSALKEAGLDVHARVQTVANAWLPWFTPRELTRWAPKLQETASLLLKKRSSFADFPLTSGMESSERQVAGVRKSRYLEWLGSTAEDPTLLRRLSETATQEKLVRQYPDTHWWEYRKELREQLQDHPRTALKKSSALSHGDGSRWHPEDRRRKTYFEVLGSALQADSPTPEQLAAIEQQLAPYDPLLTLFAHQELADLYAKAQLDPGRETAHRLHMIYYATHGDASVRNVIAAIDHLVKKPTAATSDRERFEILDGLLQTLRSRWEVRNTRPSKSMKVTQQEIERSLLAVEQAMDVMGTLAASINENESTWTTRRAVLERMLVRPFRSYRDQLIVSIRESERRTRELMHKATTEGQSEEQPKSAAAGPPDVLAN